MQIRNADNLEVETDQKQITLFDMGHVANANTRYTHLVILFQCWELVPSKCGAIMKIEADLSQNRWYELARQQGVTPQTIVISTIAH
jgi:K+ transporter